MPLAIDLGAALGLVLALLVAYGLLYVYRGSLKPLLLAFALVLEAVRIPLPFHTVHVFGKVADWIRWVAAEIDFSLGQAVLATEKGCVWVWHGLAAQARWLGGLLGDLAETVESKFRWLLLHFPPAAILRQTVQAVQALPNPLEALRRATAHAEADIARLGRGIDTVRKRVEAEIARDIARVRAQAGALRGDLLDVFARLRHAERHLTKAGAIALVGTALAALGLGWLRCPAVSRAGKRACGLSSGVLDSLLTGLLVVVGTVSLVKLTEEMVTLTEQLAGEVLGSFRETQHVKPLRFTGYSGKLG